MKAMLLVSAMLATASVANAADIKAERIGDAWRIRIAGDIEPGDHRKFLRAIEGPWSYYWPVYLTSRGGDLITGLAIGAQIRAHGMSTVADGACASVCGLIWLGGVVRAAIEGSHIGFHAAYYGESKGVTSDGNAVVGAYLRELGFSFDAIRFFTYAPLIRWNG